MCIGVRTADNYYGYGITLSISNKCFSVKINQVDLWIQRLGHASHKQLEKISKCDAVIGLRSEEHTSELHHNQRSRMPSSA